MFTKIKDILKSINDKRIFLTADLSLRKGENGVEVLKFDVDVIVVVVVEVVVVTRSVVDFVDVVVVVDVLVVEDDVVVEVTVVVVGLIVVVLSLVVVELIVLDTEGSTVVTKVARVDSMKDWADRLLFRESPLGGDKEVVPDIDLKKYK